MPPTANDTTIERSDQTTMTDRTISPKLTHSSCTRQHDKRAINLQKPQETSRVVFCLARFAAAMPADAAFEGGEDAVVVA
jgi:hypothetical protein